MTDKKVCGDCKYFIELMGVKLTGMCRLQKSKHIEDINIVFRDDLPTDHDCSHWQPKEKP